MAGTSPAMTVRSEFGSSSALPGERDLVERLVAEAFRGTRDRGAAECAIEFDRRLVVRESPQHETLHAALREIAARRGEQPPAKADTLIFRAQIEFVDLAVIDQAARAIAAVVSVAS